MSKVALVIGADEGAGRQVTRKLCEVFDGKIYVTASDDSLRRLLAGELAGAGHRVHFHRLDITSIDSIIKLRHHIQDENERIDLLINNVSSVEKHDGSTSEQIRHVLNHNFYGNLNAGRLLFPLLREGARVVVVTSAAGLLSGLPSEDLRRQFGDELTEDALVSLMQEYKNASDRGTEISEGWSHDPNVVGKVSLSALSFIQHRELGKSNISVTLVNPGSDNRGGAASPEGTEAVMYTLEASDVGGKFIWSDCKEVNWRMFIETHM